MAFQDPLLTSLPGHSARDLVRRVIASSEIWSSSRISWTFSFEKSPLHPIAVSVMPAKTVSEAGAPALKRLAKASKSCSVQVRLKPFCQSPHVRPNGLSPMFTVRSLRKMRRCVVSGRLQGDVRKGISGVQAVCPSEFLLQLL